MSARLGDTWAAAGLTDSLLRWLSSSYESIFAITASAARRGDRAAVQRSFGLLDCLGHRRRFR